MKAGPLFDDAEILRLVADGDQRAFTVLFRQYSKKVYSFALLLLKGEDAAEEVVQEVFYGFGSTGHRYLVLRTFQPT